MIDSHKSMNEIGAIGVDFMWIKGIILKKSIKGAMWWFFEDDGRKDDFD
jgi:hypothetical protein